MPVCSVCGACGSFSPEAHRRHLEADVACEGLGGAVGLVDGALEAIDGGGAFGEAEGGLYPIVRAVPVGRRGEETVGVGACDELPAIGVIIGGIDGGSDIATIAPLLYLRHEVNVTVVGEVEVECLPVVGDGGRKDADGGEILHVEGELIVVEGDGDDAVVVARYLRPVKDGVAFLRRGSVCTLCCQGELKL